MLLRFIETTERENLFINFDPANMILYGVGNRSRCLGKWAVMCAACTARMPNGPQILAKNGAPKCRWVKALWGWKSFENAKAHWLHGPVDH